MHQAVSKSFFLSFFLFFLFTKEMPLQFGTVRSCIKKREHNLGEVKTDRLDVVKDSFFHLIHQYQRGMFE